MVPRFVVVTAAGAGERLGAHCPKALVELDGRPLIVWSLEGVSALPGLAGVVVTAPADHLRQMEATARRVALPCPLVVVAGGHTRQASVRRGLEALRDIAGGEWSDATVLVHDAARCLTPTSLFDRVAAAVEAGYDAVSPALPLVDTICEAAGEVDDTIERYGRTLERARLRAVQTPQGFSADQLWQAHTCAKDALATDDTQMVSRMGGRCGIVEGDERALKITVPADLVYAHAIVASGGTP